MRLTTKLLLLVASIVTLTIVANIALTSIKVYKYLEESQIEWAGALAEAVSEGVAQDTIDGNRLKVRSLLRKLASADDTIEYAFVTDMNGQIFAHSFDVGFPRFLADRIRNNTHILYNVEQEGIYNTTEGPVVEYDTPLIAGMDGKLHLGVNNSKVSTVLNQLAVEMISPLSLVGLLAIGLVFFIGRQINLPLSRFTEQLHQYDVTDEIVFPKIKSTDPDIQQMVSTFQTIMIARAKVGADLKENEQNLSLTLNSIADAVIATDAEGKVTRLNPVAEQLTGWTLQEAKGKALKNIFSIFNEATREAIENPVDKIISTGEVVYLSNHTTLISKGGTQYQIADSAAPILDGDDIVGMVLVFRDVTEQYKLRKEAAEIEVKLQRSNVELEDRIQLRTEEYLNAKEEADRANQAKSEFLSSMSHELRTPMNAILGFSQMIAIDAEEANDEELKDNVSEIYKAGEHLLVLMNEILDLSKIESGNVNVSMENIELNPLLDECLKLIDLEAIKRNISVTNHTTSRVSHTIIADYTRIKQALLNLLSNAVKYSHDGGSIAINCKDISNDRLRISITDTGLGLSEQQQKMLFIPFERIGAETTETEGTGIGLVITKRLVEMMGGEIGVDSLPGRGSTFWIEINLSVDDSQLHAIPSQLNEEVRRENSIPASEKTILYIEDNPANLRVVAQVIAKYTPYTLISAPNAPLGLDLAESQHPDLILMDINLPGMDGYKAMEQLQIKNDTRDITVIAISANAMKSDIDRGMAAGFKEYLTKPLDLKKLQNVINKTLQDS